MRLAAVMCTPDVQVGPLALFTGSFEEKCAKAQRMGYDGVELMVRDPAGLDLARIRSVLESHNLEVPQVVTGELFGTEGLCLVTPSDEIYRRAVERIRDVLQLAATFGACVNIGRFRGRLDWIGSRRDGERLALDRIRELCDLGAHLGVKITLEPINRYETDFLLNTQEGLEFIRDLGVTNVGLMLDVFHMNIEDASIDRSLTEAFDAGVLWHVHIADSNRRYPGSGHIDFVTIVETLRRVGYAGYLSGEMLPLPDGDVAAAKTAEYILPLIGRAVAG